MKLVNLSALAVMLLAIGGSSADAESCNSFKIAAFFIDADVVKCTTATGLVPPSVPSADVLNKVCTNTACQAMIKSLKDLGLGDCTVSEVPIETAFIAPIEAYCVVKTPSSSSASSSTPSSSSATPTSAPTSQAPPRASALAAATTAAVAAVAGVTTFW